MSYIYRKYKIANIVLFVCAMVCLVCYDRFGGYGNAVFKGFTSFWFVLLGGVNLTYAVKSRINNIKPVVFIFSGLFLGMIADILLAVVFEYGVIFFALGHIMYLVGFYMIEKPHRSDLMISLPLSVVSVIVVIGNPFINVGDPLLEKGLMVYAVIISFMAGKSVSNFLAQQTLSRLLIAVSSTMFLFSDVMLMLYLFGTPSRFAWVLCIYVYWPAQTLLAHGLLHYATENTRSRVHINTTRLTTRF